jgi:fluoride exporter
VREHEDSDDDVPLPPLPIDPDAEVSYSAARWDILLVIAVGGALGSLARWGLGEAFASGRDGFPWATFLENVSGGFALGVLMVLVIDVWSPSRYVRPFFGVGVLGGYTTFSTYLLDTRNLIAADRAPLAAVYLFGTLAVGLAGVWVGIGATRAYAARSHRKGRSA